MRRWGFALFILAFAYRAFLLQYVPDEFILKNPTESAAIARSLAETGRYANGYVIPTGPTSHGLPVYTVLLALIHLVFGETMLAGYVRCFLAIAASSTLIGMMPWLATRLGLGLRAGILAGIAAVFVHLQGMLELLGWLAEGPLAAIALGLLLVGCVKRWEAPHPSAGGALLMGIGFGASFHVMPALLTVLFGCLAFEVFRRRRSAWRPVVFTLLGAALACAPWTARNIAVFHDFFFMRANFGLELRLGNHDGAAADWETMDETHARSDYRHPGANVEEARLAAELGEAEYMRRAGAEAIEWIRAHPAEFLRLSGWRAIHYWLGPLRPTVLSAGFIILTILAAVGLIRVLPVLSVSRRAAILIPLAAFPLVYYLVPYMPRYREPIDWMLFLLAAAALSPARPAGSSAE